jgi:ribonuclease R
MPILYMTLREKLLALLNTPSYTPANEFELSRRLGINKKERSTLTHEVRLLLSKGELMRVQGDKLKLKGSSGEFEGKIQFRTAGSASVTPKPMLGNTERLANIQIAAEDTSVALPGDTVIVKIFEGIEGKRPGELVGRVIKIKERSTTKVVGELRRYGQRYIVAVDDPRFVQEIEVTDPLKLNLKPSPKVGDKVIVNLNEWKQRYQPLTGTISRTIGRTHDPKTELVGVLEKFDLTPEFPSEVEREVEHLGRKVTDKDLIGREDYREIPVFTIDPDDAKDFDDALSYEPLENGSVRVGIHIADVSHYVRSGTALDKEAQKRGNSTYLVGVVIPMLPEILSNGLCSLVEAENRLCKAVFITFSQSGKIDATHFANTVICSKKRLTYKQAYALLFEDDLEKVKQLPLPPKHQTGSTGRSLRDMEDYELKDLQVWIRGLWKIASKLRKNRMLHGSLDLDMPETKIFVDADGYADRLEKVEHDESHQLIEEFMLAANEEMARLSRSERLPSLYRVHDEPDEERLEEFKQLLTTYGIDVGDLTKRENVVKMLEIIANHPQGYNLRTQFLRSLKKACYRSSADGHYGLHKKDYTHFTSPIRRYSDLVVHRVLHAYLLKSGKGVESNQGYDIKHVENLAEHLSQTEINSSEAERESNKIKLLEFFERELAKPNKTKFSVIVTEVRRHGLFIELTESMTFGFLAADKLVDDNYSLDNSGTTFVGRKKQNRIAVGSRFEVIVDKVDRYKRMIDFRKA